MCPETMSYDHKVLARSLRYWQKKLGFETQADFAKYLGISPSYISGIYAGDRQGMKKVFTIAERLGISVDELFSVRITVNILGRIMGDDEFQVQEDGSLGAVDITDLPGVTAQMLKKNNAWVVQGDCLKPAFADGDILIMEKDSSNLKSGDRVVYHDGRTGVLRWYEETADSIILRQITNPKKAQELGKRLKKLCCKLVLIIPA